MATSTPSLHHQHHLQGLHLQRRQFLRPPAQHLRLLLPPLGPILLILRHSRTRTTPPDQADVYASGFRPKSVFSHRGGVVWRPRHTGHAPERGSRVGNYAPRQAPRGAFSRKVLEPSCIVPPPLRAPASRRLWTLLGSFGPIYMPPARPARVSLASFTFAASFVDYSAVVLLVFFWCSNKYSHTDPRASYFLRPPHW